MWPSKLKNILTKVTGLSTRKKTALTQNYSLKHHFFFFFVSIKTRLAPTTAPGNKLSLFRSEC